MSQIILPCSGNACFNSMRLPVKGITRCLFHYWKIISKSFKCAYMISLSLGARPCAFCLLLHYKNRAQCFLSGSKAALRITWAASVSEWKSRLSHSFYWSVQGSWIISKLVGFRTDTELLLKPCLLSLMLTSIIHHPAGTSHFSRRLCTATEAG